MSPFLAPFFHHNPNRRMVIPRKIPRIPAAAKRAGQPFRVNVLVGGFRVLGTVISYVVSVVRFLTAHSKPMLVVLTGIAAAFTAVKIAAIAEAAAAAVAWAATLGPAALIVAAIALVAAAIAAIVLYWDDVKAAAAAAWRGIKNGAQATLSFLRSVPGRVIGAFSSVGRAIADVFETIYDNIRSGFSAAFEFIGDLPVISQLIWLVEHLSSLVSGPKASGATLAAFNKLQALGFNAKNLATYSTEYRAAKAATAPTLRNLVASGQEILGMPSIPRTGATGGNRQVIGDINTTIQVTGTGDSAETAQRTKQAFDENLATIMRHVRDGAGGGR